MIEQLLAATWIVFAGLCWIIAKSKDRNPWIWLVIGIIFGPLGMFALIVMPKAEHGQTQSP